MSFRSFKIEDIVGDILEVLFDSDTWCKLAVVGIPSFLFFWLNSCERQKMELNEKVNQATPSYLEQHHCEHVGHVAVSHGRSDGTVHKQYQCDGGLFLDYEVRNAVTHQVSREKK